MPSTEDATYILCVDDEPMVLRALRRQLQLRFGQGVLIALAGNGTQALEVVAEREPAVVISDGQMPGVDGYDLLRSIHARHPEVGKVMLTGRRVLSKRRRLEQDIPQLLYMEKPWDSEQLFAYIEHYLARAHDDIA